MTIALFCFDFFGFTAPIAGPSSVWGSVTPETPTGETGNPLHFLGLGTQENGQWFGLKIRVSMVRFRPRPPI
jgi:hypothetical protein